MFKFRRTKAHHFSADRQKVQKELFDFQKTIHHGFPQRPCALAWDPELKLLAIGTESGSIKIYGKKGVEFSHDDPDEKQIVNLFFLPNQGRVISLCTDNSLHLYEINVVDGQSVLQKVKSYSLDGRMKKITGCCLQASCEHLLIGTEGGNIYLLDVQKFTLADPIIYQDVVMQNVPDDYKVNPGAVEAIAIHPHDQNKILIGYLKGLMVLWDNAALKADQTYISNQQLESVSWHKNGKQFMSAHNDGTHITWSTADSTKQDDATKAPYGPFPCKGIQKIIWNSSKNEDFVIFSGGLPRASYDDRYVVTIQQGEKCQVLDFTSKVIDFLTISDDEDDEFTEPHSLVVLAEEEMVVIDLQSEGWPVFQMPYLVSLHSSAIICTQYANNVPSELWQKLNEVGKAQSTTVYSEKEWPISGGVTENQDSDNHCLLLTGHEDGSVKFWDASNTCLSLIYKLNTAEYFNSGEEVHEEHRDENTEDSWPPFRKVGVFDPFSDDPRMAIKKIEIDANKGIVVIGGTAGQLIVLNFNEESVEKELAAIDVNIVHDRDGFVWKGHKAVPLKNGPIKIASGFQPASVIQMNPPAALTAITVHAEWGLVACGTAHGLCIFDYIHNKELTVRCTLNPNDLSGSAADTSISRRKSFKKSLRESFRKLRRGRSQRNRKEKSGSPSRATDDKPASGTDEAQTTQPDSPSTPESIEVQSKPVERQIEPRLVDDSLGSIVRCVHFAQCYIVNSNTTSATLWAGTNAGFVYVYILDVPAADKRQEEPASAKLAKEIQLKHGAPIINIKVFDQNGSFSPASGPNQAHKVLISSEEQFKVFSLPQLKPYGKYKMTAYEGSMVRNIASAQFRSNLPDKEYIENCITCVNNQGQLSIFTVPDLKRQKIYDCIRTNDILGIMSLIFCNDGQGFYLHSPCEIQRFSLSTKSKVQPICSVDLPEGMRPEPEPEPEPQAEAEAQVKDEKEVEQEADKKDELEKVVENAIAAGIDEAAKIEDADAATDDQKSKENAEEQPMADEDTSKLESPADITIDSVKDHLGNMTISSTEESTVTVTKSADSTEISRTEVTTEEKVVTMTKTIIVNAQDAPELSLKTNGSSESEPATTNGISNDHGSEQQDD